MPKTRPLLILILAGLFFGNGCSDSQTYNSDNFRQQASPTVNQNTLVEPEDDILAPQPTKAAPEAKYKPQEPSINTQAPRGTYTNVDGNEVPRPYAAPSAPAGATARCRDGTYSFSQNRRGTCSHHGGVAEWL